MSIGIIRREIARALSSRRAAFRGKLTAWRHRQKGANLVQMEGVAGEVLQQTEFMQHAGFVSGVPAGAQVIALPLGGNTVHTIVIASEYGEYKLQVGAGEVALHHLTEPNNSVWLQSGGVVRVKATTKVLLDAPLVECTGNLHVSGNIVADGDISDHGNKSMSGMRGTYNTHTHNENNSLGGPTNTPNQGM